MKNKTVVLFIIISIIAAFGVLVILSVYVSTLRPSITDGKYSIILSCRLNKDIIDNETKKRCADAERAFSKAKIEWIKRHLDSSGY